MDRILRWCLTAALLCVLLAVVFAAAPGGALAETLTHPKVPNPAALGGARAEAVYQAIRGAIAENYAASGEPEAAAYQSWTRFNRHPYRSPNHGERFVNHFGNEKARGYGRWEGLDPLPRGAIIVKDSFTVTREGALLTGPMFVMEKMGAGFSSGAGTWRFWMLRPDGSMVGMTGGFNSKRVEFCAACHKNAGPENDFLYFMEKEHRIGRAP